MGFFKDVHKLQKMGSDMQKKSDVQASMAEASAKIVAATQMMAEANAAAPSATDPGPGSLARGGRPATATITAVSFDGASINGSAVLEIALLVLGLGAPLSVTRKELVSPASIGRAVVGGRLVVWVGDETPPTVWVDWETLP